MLIRLGFAIVPNVLFYRAANILLIATLPSPSHHIWKGAIINKLATRGHNITVISPDIDKNPPLRVHYILIEDQYTEEHRGFVKEMLAANEAVNPIFEVLGIIALCIEFCRIQVKTNGFKTLQNYPDSFKFDLIIHDYTLGP
ncbi:uncharacterized protein LOC129575667 [Sitodiplosis mosellana]|uniref:uncharacterized protein LOC129575667 n=1 Tax=Sitodiplosis mosellana TaxID=263140 RepID=UPI002443CA97|nr:uncharacterized protein LOC129575667 [Sitodiplosis mosellana]